jgi:thiol-disulfide isomerase/thioredoxin
MRKVSPATSAGILIVLSILALSVPMFLTEQRPSLVEIPTPTATRASLPDLGPAPELTNEVWFNSPALRLSALRGQVVLVNFWTFGCYNCRNVLPHVRQWYETYRQQGLTVIGVHYPEFAYEADPSNLKEALKQLDVTWPVAEDNAGITWRAYSNQYWPTLYLIDKQGAIRYLRIGEGAYTQTEAAIQALLAEPGTPGPRT